MLSSKSKVIVDNAKRSNNFHLILRVQTIMKSYLASKRAAKIKAERGMVGSGAPRVDNNYQNEVVEQIFSQLGPYDYAMAKNVVYDENIIMKGWRTLENGGNLNSKLLSVIMTNLKLTFHSKIQRRMGCKQGCKAR